MQNVKMYGLAGADRPLLNNACLAGVWAMLLGLLLAAGTMADGQPDAPGAAARLRAFAGAPARLTWIRQIAGDGNDPFCWGDQLVIMGLDTEDGRGERMVVSEVSNYHRPMLTRSGKQIVFSRIQTREAFVVDWDGGEPRRLGEGYAAAVWQDPATGTDWAYLADNGREGWDRHHAQALYRVQIANPSVRELVWDRATFTIDNLQLSADGSRACAQFPHPRAGYADFGKQSWTPLGRGCWTSMAPDNSYLVWIFDGPHRNITIHDPKADTAWLVPINTAPGMDGFEVYHPRWSNDRRFFAITGPYKVGRPGDNLIAAGGPLVNVWIGKFADDLKSVAGWQQITDDPSGNFYPDLWVARRGPDPRPDAVSAKGEDHPDSPAPYPPGLAVLWENANAANDAGPRRWDAKSQGRAFWGPFGELELDGGFFRLVAEGDAVPDSTSTDFSFELLIRPRHATVESPAVIAVNLDQPGMRWALEQAGSRLRFRVPADAAQGGQVFDLGEAVASRATHLIVVCANGTLGVWRDGQPVSSVAIPVPVVWSPRALFIGRNGADDPASAWKGRVEGFAAYERALSAEEVVARGGLVRTRLASRTDPPEYEVIVRLGEALAPPSPASILPYRRALLAQVFTVESAPPASNLKPGEEIAVAHWAVLDGVSQPRGFRGGERYALRITPFQDRPILESERIFLDADFIALPVFYEIEGAVAP